MNDDQTIFQSPSSQDVSPQPVQQSSSQPLFGQPEDTQQPFQPPDNPAPEQPVVPQEAQPRSEELSQESSYISPQVQTVEEPIVVQPQIEPLAQDKSDNISNSSHDEPKENQLNSLKKIAKVLLGLLAVLIVVALIVFIVSGLMKNKSAKITLTYWGLWENSGVMQNIISDFERQNPNIKIDYSKQDIKQYRERVLTRIANGNGPDIFRFHNTRYPMYSSVLLPLPVDTITPADFKKTFYPVTQKDLIKNGVKARYIHLIDGSYKPLGFDYELPQ